MALAFARPVDNVAMSAYVLESSDPPDATARNIIDGDPGTAVGLPAKEGGARTWWWTFGFTQVPVGPLRWVTLLASNWRQTTSASRHLYVQAAASNSWGAPPYSVEAALPGVAPDDTYPPNISIDTPTMPAGLPWVRLLFTDASAYGPGPVAGDIWLATAKRTVQGLASGMRWEVRYAMVVQNSPAGRRFAYSHDVRQIVVNGRNYYTDAEWQEIAWLIDETRGGAKPFLIHTAPTAEPLLVVFGETPQHEQENANLHTIEFEFAEVVADGVR
jgi:hypothetical protein